MKKYSRENLLAMTIKQLRLLDIRDGDMEKLVQEVIDQKTVNNPIVIEKQIFVPDIKNGEEEAYWQNKIDEQKERAKKVLLTEIPPIPESTLEETIDEIVDEVPVQVVAVEYETKRFCEFCDSKGVRHKKICPTLNANSQDIGQ